MEGWILNTFHKKHHNLGHFLQLELLSHTSIYNHATFLLHNTRQLQISRWGASNFLLTIHEENFLTTMESSNIQTFFHIGESS